MGQILANWDESDGSPYEYHLSAPRFKFGEPSWRTISYEEYKASLEKKELKSLSVASLSLWTLHLIENVEITFLMSTCDEYFSKFIELEEDEPLEIPLRIHLNYPFGEIIEATIQPIQVVHSENEENHFKFFPIGYLCWQISKVYADIYKNHWKEVGVWGHGMSDLIIEYLIIREDYTVTLGMSS